MSVRAAALVLFAILGMHSGAATAGEDGTGTWLVLGRTGSLGNDADAGGWRYGLQGGLRYFNRQPDFHQYVFRAGLAYRLGQRFTLWGGYAYFRTELEDGASRVEQRAWQQLDWEICRWESARLQSRTRLEQRFIEGAAETGWVLRQRFQFEHTLPAGDVRLKAGTESFHNLRQTDRLQEGFVQLRAYAGFEFDVGNYDVDVGYLYQRVRVRGAADTVNHLLVVGFWL